MKCPVVWFFLAVFLFCPLGLCVAEEMARPRQGAIKTTDPATKDLTEELNLSITAAEKRDARWRRDVLAPKLLQLMNDKRVEDFFATSDLDRFKRIVAQAQGSHPNPIPNANRQPLNETLELTLEQSLKIALQHNLDIRIAELSKEAVETEIPRTKARFHPTVGVGFIGSGVREVVESKPLSESKTQDGTVFVTQELPTGTGANVTLSSDLIRVATDKQTVFANMGISVVQPLLRGGGVFVATRQISNAEYDLRVEEARLRREILGVIARTKTAYFNLLLAEKVIAVTGEAIERDKILVEASQALLEAGLVTKRDLFSAEISLANDSAQLVSNQADRESAKNGLLDVLGLGIETQVTLLDRTISLQPVQMTLENWIARALKDRPEIQAIEEELAKSELNVRVAKNSVLPQTDLVASYDKGQTGSTLGRALDFRGRGWSVGVLFSYPLWNQAAKSLLTRAEIEHRRLEENLRKTKRQIELEVRASVIKIKRSLERIRPLTISVEQAKGKLEIAKARFALGQTTNFDITDAQEDILNAETDLLRAIVDYNIGLAELEARVAGVL